MEEQKRRQARVRRSRGGSGAGETPVLQGVQTDIQRRLDAIEERIDEAQLEARKRVARLLRSLRRVVAPPPRTRTPSRAASRARTTGQPRATPAEDGR